LQITGELKQRLGIRLHPSTAYHPRTNGQSKIANKAIEQYLRHFISYRQDNWEPLPPTAEFAYNNNTHTSTGVSPFFANYGYNPNFGGIPTTDQCLPSVEQRLKWIAEAQDKLKASLALAQESMKRQFDRGVKPTPNWNVGKEVWLSSKNVSTTRPSLKLGHRWLGPFPVALKISQSAYKLTLPLSMKGIHPVFHVSLLRKHAPDTIEARRTPKAEPVQVEGKEEWEVEAILDCRATRRQKEYLVCWKNFGPEENSWEPEANLTNCADMVREFNSKFPEAARRHKRTRQKK
jgi:hypothetical protein